MNNLPDGPFLGTQAHTMQEMLNHTRENGGRDIRFSTNKTWRLLVHCKFQLFKFSNLKVVTSTIDHTLSFAIKVAPAANIC
jgi:hypothetical protein